MSFSKYINAVIDNIQLIQYDFITTIFFIMHFFNIQLLETKLFLMQVDKKLIQNMSLYLNRLDTTALCN